MTDCECIWYQTTSNKLLFQNKNGDTIEVTSNLLLPLSYRYYSARYYMFDLDSFAYGCSGSFCNTCKRYLLSNTFHKKKLKTIVKYCYNWQATLAKQLIIELDIKPF